MPNIKEFYMGIDGECTFEYDNDQIKKLKLSDASTDTASVTNTATSGANPDTSLTVTVSPTAATTQQQASRKVKTIYQSSFPLNSGGWIVSETAENQIVSTAAVDKSVGFTHYTTVVGGAQVSKALGFEAVCAGLDGTSNITQYAAFYCANVAAVPNINRIGIYWAFANDYAEGIVKNVGRYVKAQKTSDGSKLREVGPTPHPGYVAGRYYGPTGAGARTPVALTANFIYTAPFYVAERTTFTKLGFRVTGAVASSNARVGIYYAEGGVPTELVVGSGNIDTATTGAKEATISTTLEAGYYMLVLHASAAITVNWCALSNSREQFGTTSDTTDETLILSTQTYGALPTTFIPAGYFDQAQACPFIWLRK